MDAEIIGSYFEEILQTLRPFSVATLELFTTSPGQILGSKQDPVISALALRMSWPSFGAGTTFP